MGKVFTPLQQNWHFYEDDAAEPTTQLANENTKPTLTDNSAIIRPRITVAETGDAAGSGTVTIEYSLNESSWVSMGASNHWNYANGQATEGNTTTTFKTTDADTHGLYHESGSVSESWSKSDILEMDFAIVATENVSLSTDYYFRVLIDSTEVSLNSGETHPQVTTASSITTTKTTTGTARIKKSASQTQTGKANIAVSGGIGFDNTDNVSGNTSSLTISSFAVGSEDNRVLIVGVSIRDDSTVSSITFNTSESFSQIESVGQSTGTSRTSVEIWGLVNPTNTTANIVINFDTAPFYAHAGAVSLYGVHQTDSFPTTNTSTGAAGDPSVSITTVNDNSWVLDTLHYRPSTTASADSQTERWVLTTTTVGAGSTSVKATAGSTSHSWTMGDSNPWVEAIIEIRESTGTTTPQTQTGTARIKKSVSQTQTGVADIQKTASQTQQGTARIALTTPQTQQGTARIEATATQTQDGQARILRTTAQTQDGQARILRTTAQTQDGQARIKLITQKTQDGQARIELITQRTQSGIALIQLITTQTQNGVANIVVSSASSQTQQGTARIKATATQTQQGAARIEATATQTQTGTARIQVTSPQTQTGTARITITSSQTQAGVANIISATKTQTQTGVARIEIISTQTQAGTARIKLVTARTQPGSARIQVTSQTQSGVARIKITSSQTQSGVANIVSGSHTQTQTGVANIKATTQQTQDGVANIVSGSHTQTQTGKGRIRKSGTPTTTFVETATTTTIVEVATSSTIVEVQTGTTITEI